MQTNTKKGEEYNCTAAIKETKTTRDNGTNREASEIKRNSSKNEGETQLFSRFLENQQNMNEFLLNQYIVL